MTDFNTLIADVYGLLDGHDLSSTIHQFSKELGEAVQKRFKKHEEEREPKLYLSNVGKPLRQLWYELKGFKGEALSPETKMKFLTGDILELLFVYLAKEAGHTVEGLQKRVEYEGVPGKIDCIIDGVLCDIKSCSSRSFEKFKFKTLFNDDPFGYVAQLTGYKKALKIDQACFIAIDKVSGEICTLFLPEKDYDLSNTIRTIRTALGTDVEPARCYEPKPLSKKDQSGNLFLSVGCSYCAFKYHCWRDINEGNGLRTFYYSSGPKYAVLVKKEPRVYSGESKETFPIKEDSE